MTPQTDDETLDFTGERMVPGKTAHSSYWEHVYRYRFAVPFVRNKRVLDIACGEGYGSAALLKSGASSVIGVDISAETCERAKRKYGLDARVGDASNIPLDDSSVDIIVSYETIEHIPEPARFLDECQRVIAPEGFLLLSTPNKTVYAAANCGYQNPFHCSEMTRDELLSLLHSRFDVPQVMTQSPVSLRIKGLRRLRRVLLWPLFCPHLTLKNGNDYQKSVISAILAPERCHSTFINPYLVAPRATWLEAPKFLVIVASAKAREQLQ